jgi:CheY-like chemotaxis protein
MSNGTHGSAAVEDQPLNREVAIGILSSLGLEIETANDGKHTLDIMQTLHLKSA